MMDFLGILRSFKQFTDKIECDMRILRITHSFPMRLICTISLSSGEVVQNAECMTIQ